MLPKAEQYESLGLLDLRVFVLSGPQPKSSIKHRMLLIFELNMYNI